MKAHAERFGTKLIYDSITQVDLHNRPFTLVGDKGVPAMPLLLLQVQPHST